MSSQHRTVEELIEKTTHYDKDERYMAVSDLCELLKQKKGTSRTDDDETTTRLSPFKSVSMEQTVCRAVMVLLHDKSNDVQALAVKTLGVMLTTVQQPQVLDIADGLILQVVDKENSELRDVYLIGLRTLLRTCPLYMGSSVCDRVLAKLLEGLGSSCGSDDDKNSKDTIEIVIVCLEALTDLLSRFGSTVVSVTRQHEPILLQCLAQLQSDAPNIRKRAGAALSVLSGVLSDVLLNQMMDHMLKSLSSSSDAATTTTTARVAILRTICCVAGEVGHRLDQEQIDRIVPILLSFTVPQDAKTGDDDDDDAEDNDDGNDSTSSLDGHTASASADELRESCFMGYASLIEKCPNEMEQHLEKVIAACLAYMCYDPNYSYGTDDDEDEAMDDNDEDEIDDDDEDDAYDDEDEDDDMGDDDESWKVRRSAIRTLQAIVLMKKHTPNVLWQNQYPIRAATTTDDVAMALVKRFKEREENCRIEIITTFKQLLDVTNECSTVAFTSCSTTDSDTAMTDDTANTIISIDLRNRYGGMLTKSSQTILAVKKGNDRTKSTVLGLLSTMCHTPGGVGGKDEILAIFQRLDAFLATTSAASDSTAANHGGGSSSHGSKTLRLDALNLVYYMLSSEHHTADHIHAALEQTLLPQLCVAVQEQWYKVIAAALRSLSEVPKFFVGASADSTEIATKLYSAAEPLLAAQDVDQEIKECALHMCGSILSCMYTSLTSDQSTRLVSLLLARLQNETTGVAAIQTLSVVASASADRGVDLSCILVDAITAMSSFIEKQLHSRSLKQHALETLNVIVCSSHGHSVTNGQELYTTVIHAIVALIDVKDMNLSHLSLRLSASILKACPAVGEAVCNDILNPALVLSISPLLQEHALDSLVALFKQITISNAIAFDKLLSMLRQRLTDQVAKQGVYNLSKCIAVVAVNSSDENAQNLLKESFATLNGTKTPEDTAALLKIQLALLVTGDIGRQVDLSAIDGTVDTLKSIYFGYFESTSEDLRSAASYALGNASAGSAASFLQAIVGKLDEDNKKQRYILLSALREFIQCSVKMSGGQDVIGQSMSTMLPPLERLAADSDAGVRTMVAECLGSLVCTQPTEMLKKLEAMQLAHSAIVAPSGTIDEKDEKSATNALVCGTVAGSVKHAIARKVDPSQLTSFMPVFAKLIEQEELQLRLAALLMVYSAVHHMPQVITGLMRESIVPSLYEVSKIKLERKVDLGPFKHIVDDALPMRKAVLSIFANCLEKMPDSLDLVEFIATMPRFLGDAEDVQLHSYQILSTLSSRYPSLVTTALDTFIEPLNKTMIKKPGTKTGTELDRLNEWIKGALQIMETLAKIDGAMNSQKFAHFVEQVKKNERLAPLFAELEE